MNLEEKVETAPKAKGVAEKRASDHILEGVDE
jgi:hypothetical protein